MDVTDMATSLISDLLQSVPSTTTADSNIAEGVHGGMRLSRLEKKEMSNKGTRKRKFLPEELKVVLTEFQLQLQALRKRRKLINNGIQAWHGRKKKQCDNQAAKVRIQALKDDDQGAYMRLVKESKDARLIRIVAETNQLLLKLRSIVQQQRDARNGSQNDTSVKEDIHIGDSNCHDDSVDLLEGQRQYNSIIHSIQEQVKEQPSILEGGELRPYQLEGLQWMLSLFNNSLNGILADDMGLGKTIQIISLIAYLKENKGVSGPHLIVAPKVVLPNWMDEFSKWLPNDKIKAVLYDGNRRDRKTIREQLSREGFDVLISHYDLIKIDKLILRKIDWHYLIVDEGHKIKNHKSAFSQIIRGYNAQRKLLLTGTPLQNNVEELWSLLNFLLPEIFDSVDQFQKWFNAPFRPRSSLSRERELLTIRRLHQVIRPFILRRKKDEVERCLPLKSQFILKCDLSAWQKVYYQQILEEQRVGLPPGSRESEEVRNLSMQLRKCCNHPGLFLKNSTMWPKEEIMRASGKFELLDRLLPKLRARGHRVLLFSQMTRLINILEIFLQSRDFKYLRLDGSEKTKKRKESLQKFNDPDSPYFMFLLSTRTGCVGLNLQTADTVIIFDSDWNPQIDLQAEDRAHRIGQDKEVRVFVLLSVGSIEEVILERAKQKKGIDAKVIQAGLFNTKSTEADRREMLEKMMRRGTSSLGTDLPSEREINGLLARSEEELRIFEQMDEERRQKENGRARLMEEHEVPTWAFSELDLGKVDEHEEGQALEEDNANNVLGKRRRKKVTYAGSGWTMAMEEYEWEPSKISSKRRRRECPSQGHESASNNGTQTEKKVVKLKIKLSAPSDRTSEDISRLAPKRCRSSDRIGVKVKQECCGTENSDHKSVGGSLLGWNNVPKRRRSAYVVQNPNS